MQFTPPGILEMTCRTAWYSRWKHHFKDFSVNLKTDSMFWVVTRDDDIKHQLPTWLLVEAHIK